MITVRDCNIFTVDFNSLETWKDFNIIVEMLSGVYKVKILEQIEGPDARLWNLELDGFKYALVNNPYGNYLKAENELSENYLKETFDELQLQFLL